MEHTCLAFFVRLDQVKNEHFAKKSSLLRKNLHLPSHRFL
jgi:hypothetical protein